MFLTNDEVAEFMGKSDQTVTVDYGRDGKKTSGGFAAARLVSTNGKPRYYVQRATFAGSAGHLFDPNSPNYQPGEELLKRNGRDRYELDLVSRLAFDYYLKYLQTAEPQWLVLAERETTQERV